ncbi:BamA/TamA family outer membrane protein [Epibacterium sp. Ofav1-8]|uniref:BamA/TamA family outer membrane protein n=1 Tax=Epibacterium sp. Ofav1-8 TaxID=2917735 RepID=UPI001EF5FA26|nr:BamA/TamA family outer membrane protein [Epibacterium sp. Ofav1-8]MCG7625116.1 BamA/TamA family outer membrane protein [Epibacterium sp. Ofav1-8]
MQSNFKGTATLPRCFKAMMCAVTGLSLLATASPIGATAASSVEVRGAQFIPEDDIQRTCAVEVGVSYSTEELRAIEACLMSTAVFEAVALYREDDVLVIDVVELDTRPGRIAGGLFYDSQDEVTASLFFERENLFPGTYGALEFSFNPEVKRLDGQLIWDDALGNGVSLGVRGFGEKLDHDDRSYAQEIYRIEPYVDWRPNELTRFEFGVGARRYSMSDVTPAASGLLAQEAASLGDVTAPYVRFGIQVHSPDAAEGDETSGRVDYEANIHQVFWNLGTDDPLSETRLSGTVLVAVKERTRLLVGLRGGAVLGLKDNYTRVIDRFFPGAEAFRGFAPRGIGPRDGPDALGGNYYLVGSVELQRQFSTRNGMNFVGSAFADVGASWGLDDTLGGVIDDSWHRRSSVGVSLTFDVASVPVSLYVAHPVESEAGDDLQTLGLSISARF